MYNILHVQQFYFIALHGGFNRAALFGPCNVTAHTLRQNLTSLENTIGVKLAVREPDFVLLPAGQAFFDYLKSFFGGIDAAIDELPGRAGKSLCIGVSENIVREYAPKAINVLPGQHAGIRFRFRGGTTAEIEAMVLRDEVAAGFALIDRLPEGLQWEPLLTLQLGLVVKKSSAITSAASLLSQPIILEKLVSPVPGSAVARAFQAELARRHCSWEPSCEVGSAWSIAKFVLGGSGIGVCVNVPVLVQHPELRFLPLEGFPELTVAALWRKDSGLPEAIRALLPHIRAHSDWRMAVSGQPENIGQRKQHRDQRTEVSRRKSGKK